MDQDRFDDLARLLGASGSRRAGLRAAFGAVGLLGLAALAAPDAEAGPRRKRRDRTDGPAAGKRRHECGPDAPCPTGYDCVKQGRKRRCLCSTGVTCDGACCPTGQVCQDGACTVPTTCVPPGEPCKGAGKPCCDGRVCASGQGGQDDVACYVPKTGACASSADCVYGTLCIDGRCGLDAPVGLGQPCNPANQVACSTPGAVCTPYNGPGAPEGAYCTLPLEYACSGDPDCTCYTCGWTLDGIASGGGEGRAARADGGPRLACCGPQGYACRTDRNCCLGGVCVNGTCQSETVCDVCASGCPYTTIAAAYDDVARFPAGSTITIAPGEYDTAVEGRDAIVTQDNLRTITFRRCGLEGSARISLSPRKLAWIQNTTTAGTISVANLDFVGGESVLAQSGNSATARLGFVMVGCSARDAYSTSQRFDIRQKVDLYLAGCVFENNEHRTGEGAVIYIDNSNDTPPTTVRSDRSRFIRNKASSNAGAIKANFGAVITAVGSEFLDNVGGSDGGALYLNNGTRFEAHDTLFRGNNVRLNQYYDGGAVYLDSNASFHATGTTLLTGNTAQQGSGIFCDETTAVCAGMVSGVSTANVTGNGPGADCQTTEGPVSCAIWA